MAGEDQAVLPPRVLFQILDTTALGFQNQTLEIGFLHTSATTASPEGLVPGAGYGAAPEVRRALYTSSLLSAYPLDDVYSFVSVLTCYWLLAARPPGSVDIALGALVVASEVSGVGARAAGVCQQRCSAARRSQTLCGAPVYDRN